MVEATLGLSRQPIQYRVKTGRERGHIPAVDFRILPEMWKVANYQAAQKRLLNLLRELSLNKLGKIQMGKRYLLKAQHRKLVSSIFFWFNTSQSRMAQRSQKQRPAQALLMRWSRNGCCLRCPKEFNFGGLQKCNCLRVKRLFLVAAAQFILAYEDDANDSMVVQRR